MTEKPDYQVGDIVKLKKASSLRQQRMGDPAGGGGFPLKMHWLRPSDHGGQEDGGEEYQRPEKERRRNVHKPMKKQKKEACI